MIIKRRVTRQFVQLDNALVRDRRLSLDEHGMLHYLLSLPDDWEVSRAQCAKFWGIGRERCGRIFRALRRTGWAKCERLQSEEGLFLGVRWVISDEPGEEVSEDALAAEDAAGMDEESATETTVAPESQAPAALVSGVSSGAAPGSIPLAAQAAPERQAPAAIHDTGKPYDGSTVVRVNRDTGKPYHPIRRPSSDEDDSETNTTGGGAISDVGTGEPPPTFGQVLKGWPPDNVVSSYACERVFVKFSAQMKRDALRSMKPYLADCRAKGQARLCDLKTYLEERRFERFVANAPASNFVVCKRSTPQAMRWREHFQRFEPHRVRLFDELMQRHGSYTTPTEWPPAMESKEAG